VTLKRNKKDDSLFVDLFPRCEYDSMFIQNDVNFNVGLFFTAVQTAACTTRDGPGGRFEQTGWEGIPWKPFVVKGVHKTRLISRKFIPRAITLKIKFFFNLSLI